MYYFIVNTTGGSGKATSTWKHVKRLLKQRKIEYKACKTHKKGDAIKLAEQISEAAGKRINLIVVGGDGTINEVLNGIRDFDKVRLGVIPTGSGNDFAKGMGIPMNTTAAFDRILAAGEGRKMDIGMLEIPGEGGETSRSRFFGISAGVGLDAIVCKKASNSTIKKFLNKFKLGHFTYIILTIYTLFSMETMRMRLILKQDGRTRVFVFPRMIFTAGMNLKYEGGGVPMAPLASARDSKISVCTAYGIPRWKAFLMLPLLIKGRQEGKKGFFLFNAQELEVLLDRPMVVHADGEYMGDSKNIRLRALPNKLRILA